MFEQFKKMADKKGLSPGTLLHVGETDNRVVQATRIHYNPSEINEEVITTPEVLRTMEADSASGVCWLNVDGIHDFDWITLAGERFKIHPLAQEDIANASQRAKYEEFEDTAYIVIRMLSIDEESLALHDEQVSLVIGPGFLVSFQEHPGDVFDGVRTRLDEGRKRLRTGNSGYLAYALLDAVVDHYFVVLEKMGEQIELLEAEVSQTPSPSTLEKIHNCKRELLFLRKSVWPLREVISSIMRDESPHFAPETLIYMRDVYDHTIQVIDAVETYRDIASGLVDLYLSSVSHRMNEVMKVLTIIATIFIPLTFVAGIYGMNFALMPELQWEWGYPAVLGVMVLIAIVMIIFFKRRHWF